MYYDVNRILVNEKFNGQKWRSGVTCSLTPQNNSVIVFDISSKTWKYQSLSNWNSYLISIGNLKLSPRQKLDSNDNIVNKTNEELYSESLIKKDEYIKIKTSIINSNFENECGKVGVDFEGNKYQYDDTSRARLLEVKDDSRVNVWRSVDDVFIPLTNVQKNNLYETMKIKYYTEFQKKSIAIDSLGV